jgi:hypothetical protein
MTKKFSVAIPDEPFKNTFELEKTVEVTYTGPKFIVVSHDPTTNRIHGVDGYFDNRDDIDLSNFVDETYQFAIIDALAHPLECAILTGYYTNPEIESYTETLITGEIWEERYTINGILDNLFNKWNLKYYPDTDSLSEPEYQTFPTTREQFLQSLTVAIDAMTKEKASALAAGESESEIAKYDNIISWCENFEETYGDTEHWKIPFPTL